MMGHKSVHALRHPLHQNQLNEIIPESVPGDPISCFPFGSGHVSTLSNSIFLRRVDGYLRTKNPFCSLKRKGYIISTQGHELIGNFIS